MEIIIVPCILYFRRDEGRGVINFRTIIFQHFFNSVQEGFNAPSRFSPCTGLDKLSQRYYRIADKIEEGLSLVSEKSWAAFGKWAFASLAAALFFFGVACLLGRVEEVERAAGPFLRWK